MDRKFSNYLKYDESSGIMVWIKSPNGTKNKVGYTAGYVEKTGYLRLRFDRKNHSVHRVAWLLYYGVWPSKNIDHINGIKHDNRIINLRDISTIENAGNLKRHRNGFFNGVTYHKKNKKWRARISIKGKTEHIGYFKTEIEAKNAYQEKEKNGI